MLELIDIGKTVCEFAGVTSHDLDQGKSLQAVLSGQNPGHRDSVYCEMGCDKMLYDGRYKLVWGEPTKDTRKDLGRLHLDKPVTISHSPAALFDLQEDPDEKHNLIDDEQHQELTRMMMEKLLTRINANTQALPNLDRGEFRPYTV
ncbi:MAG: hypothetical protein HRU15_16475 [Planctomycetes bacterium]|nr:hypothetical protein [Planctomycetota bacterium]